jgi:hypothetical protein
LRSEQASREQEIRWGAGTEARDDSAAHAHRNVDDSKKYCVDDVPDQCCSFL